MTRKRAGRAIIAAHYKIKEVRAALAGVREAKEKI